MNMPSLVTVRARITSPGWSSWLGLGLELGLGLGLGIGLGLGLGLGMIP